MSHLPTNEVVRALEDAVANAYARFVHLRGVSTGRAGWITEAERAFSELYRSVVDVVPALCAGQAHGDVLARMVDSGGRTPDAANNTPLLSSGLAPLLLDAATLPVVAEPPSHAGDLDSPSESSETTHNAGTRPRFGWGFSRPGGCRAGEGG